MLPLRAVTYVDVVIGSFFASMNRFKKFQSFLCWRKVFRQQIWSFSSLVSSIAGPIWMHSSCYTFYCGEKRGAIEEEETETHKTKPEQENHLGRRRRENMKEISLYECSLSDLCWFHFWLFWHRRAYINISPIFRCVALFSFSFRGVWFVYVCLLAREPAFLHNFASSLVWLMGFEVVFFVLLHLRGKVCEWCQLIYNELKIFTINLTNDVNCSLCPYNTHVFYEHPTNWTN